jgi:CHAT domain-containing protein
VGIYLLGTTPEVAAQVATMRTLIEAGKPFEALAPASQALYAVLIRPLEGRLGRAHTLVISPDGPLAFLPFELLSDGSRLLLERYVIRYTPTGRDLIRLRLNPSPVAAGPAAVFGNPSFGLAAPVGARSGPSRSLTELLRNANFAALPGTEGEAQVVAALLGAQTRLFLGEAANEQNLFGLESPRVLHLATHGFFVNDPDIPNPLLRVGIALAGAKASVAAGEQYGLLTALQLAALNLRGTRLVVLSACETGLGDVVAGEGVAGLNQAFLTAGVRGIVLSLWKVPDRETGLLMERFYQLWTAGKPEAEALREAKLELRQRGLAPWYWAAFLLSGE